MIHRNNKEYDAGFVAECDTCGELLETEVSEFYRVPEMLRQHGWITSVNKKGKWKHECEVCVAEKRNSQNDFTV